MKNVISIALLLSVLGNFVLLYRVFDMGLTSTYEADEISRRGHQVANVQKLLPLLVPNMSRANLLSAARKANLEILEKGEEGLYVGGIRFLLSGDRVVAVNFD
jgi:hypothetical protein